MNLKIRCHNCYKVLKKNEDYCTHCGTYSEAMHDLMVNGTTEIDSTAEFKSSLIMYLAIGFLGTGIFTIALALIYKNVANYTWDWILEISKYNSILITSILLLILLLIIYRKELSSMVYNCEATQFFGALLIGMISIGAVFLLSELTTFTRIIPNFVTLYLDGGVRYLADGGGISIATLFIGLACITISEEIVIRKRLIDALDDDTLLSDVSIVIISALAGTLFNFLWVMTVETILMTFVINIIMSILYINTNRSIGVNVILRIILLILVFII